MQYEMCTQSYMITEMTAYTDGVSLSVVPNGDHVALLKFGLSEIRMAAT